MSWAFAAAKALRAEGLDFIAVTSTPTADYNCIAWAADDKSRWWWPTGKWYWPGRRKGPDVPPTIGAFVVAFRTLGYEQCADGSLVPGIEKVALYGIGDVVKHAARQLPSGRWTSKCGRGADVEHTLPQMNCGAYGAPIAFLSRPVKGAAQATAPTGAPAQGTTAAAPAPAVVPPAKP